MANAEVLEAIADPDFQTELGQFNVEINLAAAAARAATVFAELEETVRASLNRAEEQAAQRRRAHDDDRDPADARPSST